MKKLLTIIFFLLSFSSEAAKYHFSTISGDDSRSSATATNPNTPWRTIQKLNSFFSSLLPGDSVLFKRNETFYGQIVVTKSGVNIGAYSTGNQPIITSLVNLSGWTLYSSNIWVSSANASLGSTVNIVLRNDNLLHVARYPNITAPNKGYLAFENSSISSITDNNLPLIPNHSGQDITIRKNHFETEVRTVVSQSGTGILTVSTPFSGTPTKNMGYFFQNSLSLIDEDGEFYYDPAAKRIYIYSTTIPTGIQASTLNTLLTSANFNNVSITNLYFKGTNDTAIKIGVPNPGIGGSGNTIQNCTINFSKMAIYSSRHTNMNILSNSISDALGGAIYVVGADNSNILYNYINNTAQISGMGNEGSAAGVGIFEHGTSVNVKYNSVNYTGYTGIRIDGDNTDCQYNFVNHFCNRKNDGGGIYYIPGTTARTGWKIRNNIVLYGDGAIEGGLYPYPFTQTAAIYLDAGITGAANGLVQGNTGAFCEYGYHCHRNNNVTVLDNTFYSNSFNLFINSDNNSLLIRNMVVRRNTFFAKTLAQQTAWYQTVNGDINLFGSIDSNYYEKPIREPQGIANAGTSASGGTIRVTRGTTGWYSPDKFHSYIPAYETHYHISPKGYDTIRFEVNTSYRDSVVILNYGNRDYTWITFDGRRIKGTYTMPPFSSLGMIKDTIVPVSIIPNVPPTVSLTSPANNASYVAPATVNIAATASDADGTISIVRFYSGNILIGSDNISPYTLTVINMPSGGYSLTAHAVDNSGDSTISGPVAISVVAVNVPPAVSITSPANNSNFSTPADISLEADATDQNDSILVVDFYENGIYIGSDSVRPYTFTVSGRTTGTYNYFAIAKDYAGDQTTSASITVTVNPPPPLAANSDVGIILCNGQSTIITISATGGTSPYLGTGSNVVSAGTYTYIVEDFDGTKDTIVVTVSQPAVLSLTDSIGAIGSYGGSTEAHIFPTGGTAPYQYQINNGFWQASNIFVIQAGGYLVNVRDANGCSENIFFSVTQPTSTGPLNMQIKRPGEHININR